MHVYCTTNIVHKFRSRIIVKVKRYMHDAYIQDGFLYGLVEKKNDLEKILELHSLATLSDYIKR